MAIERLTIANYNNLENKPIAAKNLATEIVEDNNYYLNKAAEKLVYTENPTNPDGSTINKIYYNMNVSVDDVGQSLLNMPWDTAVVSEQDGTLLKFLQLIGADTAENGGRGIYATKISLPIGNLYYIIAGLPNFNGEPQLLFQYSADFGPHDMDSDVDAWGWAVNEASELVTWSSLAITESFTFNYMANKECWDTWFSTSNEFASSFDFEANTIYKYVDKAYKKIDGNVIEPVDKLPQPTEALKSRVVYNKEDNQIYECKEITGGISESPISIESLLPVYTTWDSCTANAYSKFFVNTNIDSNIVKAIFADNDSGTLITVHEGSEPLRYISYQHSGDELQIIDNTDSCSPRTIFDSANGGWQISTDNGWSWHNSDSDHLYPIYQVKSDRHQYSANMQLTHKDAPIGCLFAVPTGWNWSPADGSPFASYNLVDNVYLNIHRNFDDLKISTDSSTPMIELMIMDTTKQSTYSILFFNSARIGLEGGWMILASDKNENFYPIYAENTFNWSDASSGSDSSDAHHITITTAGWQSEYVDLTTGKLKLPANGSISDVGRSIVCLRSRNLKVDEDILGNYIAGTPFSKIEGVYKWSNIATNKNETLKLSGNDYKIIQHTGGDLTINRNNGAENVIILGTINGTLTIEREAVKQLTYIGFCSNLTIDLRDWPTYSSAEYPTINLIGDGIVTIYGNRMAVTATDSVVVEESNNDANAYKWCNIKAGKDITYKFNVGQKDNKNHSPAYFDCDGLTIENLTGDYSSVCRLIEAHCNHFNIQGNKAFLQNTENQAGSYDNGSRLILHMPSYSLAANDGSYAQNYAGPGSILGDLHLFTSHDECNSYYREWKTIQDYVDSKANSGSGNSIKYNPTVIAKSRMPIDAYDTCTSYNMLYLNGHFADDYDSDMTMSGLTLLQGNTTGDSVRIDYTAHNPSSLSLYVYDASAGANYNGAITKELYKNGKWIFDFTTGLRGNSTWKINSSLSVKEAQIINKLFAQTLWEYIPLSFVQDGVVPPNTYGDDLDTFFKHDMSSGALTDTSFYTGHPVLYQCVWEGNISLGHADYSGFTSARVVFKPIWGGWSGDSNKITCTSESIGPKTLTLITRYSGTIPEINILGEDGFIREGILYWKPLYVVKN